jgi:hypothetical protein
MVSDPKLYNGSLFVALIGTESRTKGMGIQQSRDRIGESSWVVQYSWRETVQSKKRTACQIVICELLYPVV